MPPVNSNESPRYKLKAFAATEAAEKWLDEMAAIEYHFHSMSAMMGTNHFSKEMEGLMWVIVEKDTWSPPNAGA